ncbi:polysaccharide deacetylase family protein [Chloroflexota bacterium]
MKIFETTTCQWKNNARASLTLSFDGGYAMSLDLVLDALVRYKMPATWFIVTRSVGKELQDRAVATWDDFKKLSEMGMEIGSHTATHPRLAYSIFQSGFMLLQGVLKKKWALLSVRNITKVKRAVLVTKSQSQGVCHSEIRAEALQSKSAIEAHIPGVKMVSFAYPGGRYNSALKNGIKDAGYLSARSTDSGYNFPKSVDLFALKSKVWDNNVHIELANEWVDSAFNEGSWLIETYHVISKSGTTGYRYDAAISDVEAHLAYILSKDIWVDTQNNIVRYIVEKNNTKVKVDVLTGDRVVILLKTDLSSPVHGDVLTLKTFIPPTWRNVTVEQDGDALWSTSGQESNRSFVYYNVKPDNGEITLVNGLVE